MLSEEVLDRSTVISVVSDIAICCNFKGGAIVVDEHGAAEN